MAHRWRAPARAPRQLEQESLAGRTHTRRLSTLEEMANMAVVMASDKASGMTGTIVNLTMGGLDD
jgi:enoyl-[acyl-carrier-protein] reductase (NADH)